MSRRVTQDIDFFTGPGRGEVSIARNGLIQEADRQNWIVESLADQTTFARLLLRRGEETVLVDIALDSTPENPADLSSLGPTFAPAELAARKTVALFDRAAPRDFVDVYVLAERFGKDNLLAGAVGIDAGFNTSIFVQMLERLPHLKDDQIPIAESEVAALRHFFTDWTSELKTSIQS